MNLKPSFAFVAIEVWKMSFWDLWDVQIFDKQEQEQGGTGQKPLRLWSQLVCDYNPIRRCLNIIPVAEHPYQIRLLHIFSVVGPSIQLLGGTQSSTTRLSALPHLVCRVGVSSSPVESTAAATSWFAPPTRQRLVCSAIAALYLKPFVIHRLSVVQGSIFLLKRGASSSDLSMEAASKQLENMKSINLDINSTTGA
ncbi:hypothetical protein Syun_017541 [Stephania yunnanensis]|uniref:Uncharacterized protein n=1 Tax=Stephania yunnanensis TaxID=152371 RepID=A0AAP0J739_9MAGN